MLINVAAAGLPVAMSVAAPAAERPAFPLKASANGRYLVDSRGRPFLVHADTGWRAAMRLKRDETLRYLDDRKARGFNALHFHAINKEKEGMANPYGEKPFTPETDVTRPNEAYWKHLDALLDAATERGFFLLVSSAWFGWNGTGWRSDLAPENARLYGRFLGARYRRLSNILWIHGGDNDPGDKADVIHALAQGIKETASHHLHTVHNGPEHASAAFFQEADWLDVNMAYTYDLAYKQVGAEFARKGRVRPILLGETGYEGESNPGYLCTPYLVRRQAYWALLSGAAGHSYGNGPIWYFGDGWQAALDEPGANQMRHVYALFAARPWWKLAPEREGTLITAGGGTDGAADYVTAARAGDGSFALAYLPTPRSVTVNLSRLSGKRLRAFWHNPRDGGAYDLQGRAAENAMEKPGEAMANSGTREFTPPTRGAEDDWLLVIEAAE